MGFYPFAPPGYLTALATVHPSGDTTGATDTAIIKAVTAAGQVPWLAPGTYYANQTLLFGAGQCMYGAGRNAVTINWLGSGACIRAFGTGVSPAAGAALAGFTVNGTGHVAGASSGFHLGDMFQLDLDIAAAGFTGPGDIGVWLDNQYTYTEQITGKIYVTNNTNGVVFDNSTGTTLSANATGSFDRFNAKIFLVSAGAGNGVTWQNGAFIFDGDFGIFGNMTTAATQYACMTVTGSNAGGFSRVMRSNVTVGVELRNAGGLAPYTILFGTTNSNIIWDCTGMVDFASNATFTSSNQLVGNFDGSFKFDGPVFGDVNLFRSHFLGQNPYQAGILATGGTIPNAAGLVRVNNTGAITGMILEGTTPNIDNFRQITVQNIGTGSITFAAAGTSNVADGVASVIAVNTAVTFQWDAFQFLWYRVP